MKRKFFMLLPFLLGVLTSLVCISWIPKGASSNAKMPECDYCDPAKYKEIYSRDGYVLLQAVSRDSLVLKDIKSERIADDTASRMIRYYIKKRMGAKQPIVIDFDHSSIGYIMTTLASPNLPSDKLKGLRIYLSAYDTKMANELHTELSVPRRAELDGYMTTILVGTYDGKDTTDAVNLGNICPPNCPDDPPGANTPNLDKLKFLRLANRRTDIYP